MKVILALPFLICTMTIYARDTCVKYISTKAKMSFKSDDYSQNLNISIRSNNKDTIWASIRGELPIEGVRLLLTRDSAFVNDYINDTFYAILQSEFKIFNIKFDYDMINDLFLIPSKKLFKDTFWYSDTSYELIDNMLNRYRYTHNNDKLYKLNYFNTKYGYGYELTYTNYNQIKPINIATDRELNVSDTYQSRDKSDINLNIDCSSYDYIFKIHLSKIELNDYKSFPFKPINGK